MAASIPPIAAIVRDVAGSDFQVAVVLPAGASPHGYEPGPRATRRLAGAAVHFVVGRGLDDWVESMARGANPSARAIRLGEDPDLPGPEPTIDGAGTEAGRDPHVWLDPRKAAAMARRAAREIADRFPDRREAVEGRLRDVERRYARLDSACAARLGPVRGIPFLANHSGLNHLVARYGLRQIGVLEAFHGAEPSPRFLKEMIARSRSEGAKAIFVEPQSATRLAEAVSIETGIPRVEIDPLGMARPDLAYEEILLACVDRIAAALSGGGTP